MTVSPPPSAAPSGSRWGVSARVIWLCAAAVAVGLPSAAAPAQGQGPPTDNPARRWQFFYEQRAYPFTRVPSDAMQTARARMLQRWPQLRSPTATMSADPWISVGPQQIIFGGPAPAATGRLSTIAVHPTNANIIYIGGAQGGVWQTVDGGGSWIPLTDRECSLAMGALALDPVDPSIVYAATGEQHFSGDSYYGCGVLRSEDGGTTWTHLGESTFRTTTGGARISRVVIDPTTAGNVTTTEVFAASDFGLFRSTDGGVTWFNVLNGTITDLVMDPTDATVMYAARGATFGAPENGVFKSTDGGQSWSPSGTGLPTSDVGRINLAIAPSEPSVLFASIHHPSDGSLRGLYRTVNGGATWANRPATNASCGSQCWYDMTLAIHPQDTSVIYFGGIALYRSNDGGGSFENILGAIHVDQHTLTFDPQNPDVLLAGNDGGIYRSDDAGTTWTGLNTNLALTQFYSGVTPHPTDPSVVLGGTQDNGTVLSSGTAAWDHVLGGDGGYTAIDYDNPTFAYSETQWSSGSTFSGPRRSDVGGAVGSFMRKVDGINTGDRALFIPPLVMDPLDPQTLYFGTYRVYRTTNRGDAWSAISSDLTGGQGAVTAIAAAPSDPAVIYAGTSRGRLQVTMDGGTTWTERSGGLPNRFVRDIAVHPSDPLTAYVTVSGFLTGHVFRTANGGASWQDISMDLPDLPVNAILVDPGNPDSLFVGTDLGVFTSNAGTTWTPLNDGLPLVAVFDLALAANTGVMAAATHGRGVFTRTLVVPLTLRLPVASRSDSLPVGSSTSTDSALVRPYGTGGNVATWSAASDGSSWITVTTPSGTGTDFVRWERDATGLDVGTHVAVLTVTPTSFAGDPVTITDSLVVLPSVSLGRTGAADTLVLGEAVTSSDSVALVVGGNGSWNAGTSGAPWLTVTTPSGQGSGFVRWERAPQGLDVGLYMGTVTVTGEGGASDLVSVADSMWIIPPLQTVIDAALGIGALPAGHEQFLDDGGNADGTFNLGDLLAYLNFVGALAPSPSPDSPGPGSPGPTDRPSPAHPSSGASARGARP